jgi:DNA-directed RNA polymerase specialized sigma24 family protein
VSDDRERSSDEAHGRGWAHRVFRWKFDPRRFPEPLSWLTTTLKRKWWEIARRAEARRNRSDEGEMVKRVAASDGDPAERAERLALVGEVRAAMERLKPQERRVIGLLALGSSYREIMELTGWTFTKVNRCSAEEGPG